MFRLFGQCLLLVSTVASRSLQESGNRTVSRLDGYVYVAGLCLCIWSLFELRRDD